MDAEFDILAGFHLGDWEVQPRLNRLRSTDQTHFVEGKAMDVLVALALSRRRVASKNDLLDAVWPNQSVAEGTLTLAIHELRVALDDDAKNPTYIGTVTRRGYRLLCIPQPLEASEASAPATPRTRTLRVALIALAVVAVLAIWRLPQVDGGAHMISSVAVLPFSNLTGDDTKDYIGEGLAEEVIHLIAQQPRLLVAARTSSFAVGREDLTAEAIGERLQVDAIIEGSVREERGVQRITLQLIDVNSGAHRGSATLDIVDSDLFDAQARIGETVTTLLAQAGAQVDPAVRTSGHTTDSRTYDLYLRGRAAMRTRSVESLTNAQSYFEEAIRLDKAFAPAYAGMSQLHLVSRVYLQADAELAIELADEFSRRALDLDANNVEAVTVAAAVAIVRRNYEQGIALFHRAIELQPGNALAHQWLGEALSTLGYVGAGRGEVETALRLNPLAGSTNTVRANMASFYVDDGDLYTAAARGDALGARLAPRLLSLHYFRVGDHDAFVREMRRYYAVIGVDPAAADVLRQALDDDIPAAELVARLAPFGNVRDGNFARELALLGFVAEAGNMLKRIQPEDRTFSDDIWLPEFRAVRALPMFNEHVARRGLLAHWHKHGPPDLCLGRNPETFCLAIHYHDASATPESTP